MKAAGTPLVLLSGLLCDERLWHHQVGVLGVEMDIFVPDLTLDDSLEAMAKRVLSSAPDRFALAALSMGGYVAFEIMRQAPERVSRLALIDTQASPDTPEKRKIRQDLLALAEIGKFKGVTPRLLPKLVHPRCIATPVSELVKAMADSIGKEGFVRQQQAIITRPDYRPMLSSIGVETLVVVGEDDEITPLDESELIHRGIPGSSLVVLPECGHLPPLEHPGKITQLLRSWFG